MSPTKVESETHSRHPQRDSLADYQNFPAAFAINRVFDRCVGGGVDATAAAFPVPN
jgi:hypothetical protein